MRQTVLDVTGLAIAPKKGHDLFQAWMNGLKGWTRQMESERQWLVYMDGEL